MMSLRLIVRLKLVGQQPLHLKINKKRSKTGHLTTLINFI